MNLDKLTVNVKPLSAYQAMDLGLAVARAWYVELWQLWWRANAWLLVVMVGLGVLLHFWFIQNDWGFAGYLLPLWWCKPWLERPLLIYLSQRLFNDDYQIQDVKETAKTMPTLRFMLLRRFGLKRMMIMPVHLLERQSQTNAKARLHVLTRHQDNAIILHSVIFFAIEVVFYMVAAWVFVELLGLGTATELHHQSILIQMLWGLFELGLYLLVMSVITPFFVASGFMMYLCKRSLLEGWDIELTFRKLVYRYQQQQNTPQQGRQS